MSDETKAYRVSLSDGSEPLTVTVPLRAPFTKRVRRHFETARELPDGRKKLEFELRTVEVPINVEAEMRADAVRAWNGNRGSAIAARNLIIDPCVEVVPAPTVTVSAPARIAKSKSLEPVAV